MSRFLFVGAVVIGLVPSPGQAQPAPGDVVINEVMYAPSPSTNEFIELYNRSEASVDLSQLSFADDQLDYTPVAQSETLLAPDDYVVLVRDPGAFESAFPSVEYHTPSGWDALNNGGDTVYLRHTASNTVLDSVPYTPSWGGSDGGSLERIDPRGPSDRAENFAPSEAGAGATPGAENSVYDPDETPPTLEAVTPSPEGDSLTAVFSEPLPLSTVSSASFHLEGPDAPSVVDVVTDDSSPPRQVQCVLGSTLSTGSYTLVATDMADQRGNVRSETQATFSFFEPDRPQPGEIVVSEVMYAPTVASSEFIELYNASNKTFDLGDLEYADDNRDYASVAPPLTPFEPNTYVVLVRDSAAFETTYSDTAHLAPGGWDALNNGGDMPLVRHASSETVLDSVPYAPSWGGAEGTSLERIDPRGPSDSPSNFASSTAPLGATPGAENSRHAPDTSPPSPVFAEQVGDTAGRVFFNEPLHPSRLRPASFQLDDVTITKVQLPVDSIVRLSFSAAPTTSVLTVKNVEDRVGNPMDEVTIPFAHRPVPEDIAINEILYDPRADDFDDRPNQVEFVELLNRTDRPLTLNEWTLTDRPTEEGQADTLRMGRPRALPPEGMAVVAAAPKGSSTASESQLAEAFPNAPLTDETVRFLPVQASRLGLDNDGDLVRLHRADGQPVAEVDFAPDWHAAGVADPKGIALERISPRAKASAKDNWTSSTAADGGTPGASNSVHIDPESPPPEDPGLTIAPSPFSIERDGGTSIQYRLSDVPNLVRVRIYDSRGRKVRTLEDARLAGRTGELIWNGRNDAGQRVRIGVYVVLFEAVRAEEGTVRRFKEPVVLARPLN